MNEETSQTLNPRYRERIKTVQDQTRKEFKEARELLEKRSDYHPVWDYFLDILMRINDPNILEEAVDRPLVEHLCNQAPYELFHAMGVHPVRLISGCFSAGQLSASQFPVLMCPMLKSTVGMMQMNHPSLSSGALRVVPTTCDWVVKFQEMTDGSLCDTCFLELPHLRESEKGQQRWIEEIYGLVDFLEDRTGRKLKRKTLLSSVKTFMAAWDALGQLIEYRRNGTVAGVWFMVVANSFMLDPIETWTEQIHRVLAMLQTRTPPRQGKGIFLAGTPVVFPNYKLLHLIESAGMDVYADDLCTGERIWPGAVRYEDPSYQGLIRALAERYHKGCICPTFADNERRINSILNILAQHPIKGVICHVLKGCHPFDIESFDLETRIKSAGHKFW